MTSADSNERPRKRSRYVMTLDGRPRWWFAAVLVVGLVVAFGSRELRRARREARDERRVQEAVQRRLASHCLAAEALVTFALDPSQATRFEWPDEFELMLPPTRSHLYLDFTVEFLDESGQWSAPTSFRMETWSDRVAQLVRIDADGSHEPVLLPLELDTHSVPVSRLPEFLRTLPRR